MFMRRTIHFCSCAQDKTTTVFKMKRIWIKSSIIDHIPLILNIFYFFGLEVFCVVVCKKNHLYGEFVIFYFFSLPEL